MPCASDTYEGGFAGNVRWENWAQTVRTNIPLYYTPQRLSDLVNVVSIAEVTGQRVKAVGSGLSFENIAVSRNIVVDLANLNYRLTYLVDGAAPALTAARRGQELVHVEAGMSLFDLNTLLLSRGQALPSLGGVQKQTIAGATSTGTHGSDVHLPPVHDFIQAIHLVTTGGQEVWIESASQPLTTSDDDLRTAFASASASQRPCADILIIRDDDALYAARCGMGRFGVIYSVVLQVTGAFRLAEWGEYLSWPAVRAALLSSVGASGTGVFADLIAMLRDPPSALDIATTPDDYQYLDISFNPRRATGCWVRRRWRTTNTNDLGGGGGPSALCHHTVGNLVLAAASAGLATYAGAIAQIPFYGWVKAAEIGVRAADLAHASLDPHMTGGHALAMAVNAVWGSQVFGGELRGLLDELNQIVMNESMKPTVGDGTRGVGWRVTSQDIASFDQMCYRGRSVEITFDMGTRAWIDFIQSLLDAGGNYCQAGWVSVRFSRRSDAFLSMHHVAHEVAVAIEITSLAELADNDRWMSWLELTGKALGGRPHWGQENSLRANEVMSLHGAEALGRWRNQLLRVAGLSSTFSNDYTFQRGLEPVSIRRQVTGARRAGGAITHLCHAGEFWSPVAAADAMTEITLGIANYVVVSPSTGEAANVIVRRYLATAPDASPDNNLDALPSIPELVAALLPPPPAGLMSRRVTVVSRDGGIRRLCNAAERWSVSEEDAFQHVRARRYSYYVESSAGTRAELEAREYLATEPDATADNNLASLPPC